MAEPPVKGRSRRTAPRISPEEYAAFIRQIELNAVWLHELSVTNHHGPTTPERAAIDINAGARWEPWTDGFQVFQHYELRLQAEEQNLAEISVTFGLRYISSEQPSKPLFEVFRANNLPLNTWPYLRELVFTLIGRMNWLPVTLPVFKVEARQARPSDQKRPSRAKPASARDRSREN